MVEFLALLFGFGVLMYANRQEKNDEILHFSDIEIQNSKTIKKSI